jgi:hypothetical protein
MSIPASGNAVACDAFSISWSAADPDDDAQIALYYDTNNAGLDGTLIVGGLSEDATTQYVWNCSGIAENTYYIYAVIDDGTNMAVTDYSDGTVQVDHNFAPSVNLTGPSDGSTFTVPTTAALTAHATDQDGNLQQVDFYIDGELIGTSYNTPFSAEWSDLKKGSYTFQARAMDTEGLTAWSGTRTIHVDTPPLEATFAVESAGWKSTYAGHSIFRRDGEIKHAGYSSSGTGRGLNVLAYDLDWGARITFGKHFDTYATRRTDGAEHYALIDYINSLPNGSLIMISACDDAGLTYFQGEDYDPEGFPGWDDDEVLHHEWASNVVSLLESLGSVQIDNYSYQASWCMIAVKGSGLLDEVISANAQTITAQVTWAVGSVDLTYDYRNNMSYHNYWDCHDLYVNQATPEATCHAGTDTVCAYVNDKHRNQLTFTASKRFVTDGMKFFARIDESQYEHMNVRVNNTTYRWEDWANPCPGEDVWQKFPMHGDYQINNGSGNDMRVATDHFQTCGSGDGSVHFDEFGGERGEFILYTTDGDDDDDGLPDEWETYYGFDPLDPYDAEGDRDNDGLSNLGEYNNGTNPGYFDTDEDLLTDAFEVGYGLDPVSSIDTTNDQDSDGVDNLTEQIYGTNPMNSDTDGDNCNDGTEIAQGSDPTDKKDEDAPSEEDKVTLRLSCGDPSGSESERYCLSVGHVGHQSPGYGEVSEADYTFERGRKYTISIEHMGTDPEYTGTPNPDYDYQAVVSAPDGDRIFIDDPDEILGSWDNVGDDFKAAGKTATLYIPKLQINGFSRGDGVQINETYPLHSEVDSPALYDCTMSVFLEPMELESYLGITTYDFSIVGTTHGAGIDQWGTITPGYLQSGEITVRAELPGYSDVFVESPFVVKAVPTGIASTSESSGPRDGCFALFVKHTFASSGGSLEGISIKEDIKQDGGNKFSTYFNPDLGNGHTTWTLNSGGTMTNPDRLSTPHADVERAVQNGKFPDIHDPDFSHTDWTSQFYGFHDPVGNIWVPCTGTFSIGMTLYRDGTVLRFRTAAYGQDDYDVYTGYVP